MNRTYTDLEWAQIVSGLWNLESATQERALMSTKRTLWSSALCKEYGLIIRPIMRPSRALVDGMLGYLGKNQA